MLHIRNERKETQPEGVARTYRKSATVGLRAALCLVVALILAPAVQAATFNVTKTADTNDGSCDADCSLREAVRAANATPGADTINIPAGTYTLTILPTGDDAAARGDLDINESVTINGAGSATTIVEAGAAAFSGIDRVFDIGRLPIGAAVDVTISNLTIRNGKPTGVAGGGGIRFDGFNPSTAQPTGSLTLFNCVVTGNQASADGGGIRSAAGRVTINNSTISNNKTVDGNGGGIYHVGNQPLEVGATTFTGNAAGATTLDVSGSPIFGKGGGVYVAGAIFTSKLLRSTFTGNTAGNRGGAVSNGGLLDLNYNRIVGNTSAGTGASGLSHDTGAVNAANNWWGCNGDPAAGATGCDTVSGTSADPRLVLNHTADPNTVEVGGTSTLSANFFTNSSGDTIAPADLVVLEGLAVTFSNASGGTISNAETQITGGDATATFTAGSTGGNGGADATVENATVRANIFIGEAPTIDCPDNITVDAAPGETTASVSFNVTATGVPSPTVECRIGATVITSPHTFPEGTTTVNCTASNGVGADASCSFTVTVNADDTTPPEITCPANITVNLPLNSTATSMPVNFTVTATDNEPGVTVVTKVGTTVITSPHTFPVGTTTVTATATDAAGNTDTCTFTVTVLYNFTGFFSPVANPPVVNQVKAGQSVPVKFSLSGDKGLAIFAAGYPASSPYACDEEAPEVDIEGLPPVASNSLSYDAATDRYNFVWKTDKAWAGQCRQLIVVFADGSVHRANFKFK